MKLLVVVIAAAAWGTELTGAGVTNLTICMNTGDANQHAFYAARAIAGQMLAEAGVKILWRVNVDACLRLPDAIVVRVSTTTPTRLKLGALGYAFPFKGNEIEIFYDRILVNAKGMDFAPILLGYVLTHEIVHLLQGLADHSGIGVMKALWTQDDHSLMRKHNLPLANKDIDMIQRGLTKMASAKK